MRRIILLAGVMALMVEPAAAERVVLKSGRVLEGKITNQTDQYITVDVKGVSHTYKMEAVALIGEVAKEEAPEVAPAQEAKLADSIAVLAPQAEAEAVPVVEMVEEPVTEAFEVLEAPEAPEVTETFEAAEMIESDEVFQEQAEVELIEEVIIKEIVEEAVEEIAEEAVEEAVEVEAVVEIEAGEEAAPAQEEAQAEDVEELQDAVESMLN